MASTFADVLVVGAAGTLTDALARNLARRGLHVVCQAEGYPVDDTACRFHDPGGVDSTARGHIEPVLINPSDPAGIDALLARCERLIFLPGLGEDRAAGSDPAAMLDEQSTLVHHLMRAAPQHGRPMLHVESADDGDGVSDDSLQRQVWRLVASQVDLLARAQTDRGWAFASARLFGVHGSDVHRWGQPGLAGRLLTQLLAEEPLVLADGGTPVRSFCTVDDAAEALARLALGLNVEAPYRGRCIDVGHPHPVTVAEFAREMAVLTGHRREARPATDAEYGNAMPVSPLLPNTQALDQAVGYVPATDTHTGLRHTLAELQCLTETPNIERPALVPNIRPYFEVDRHLSARIGHILVSGQATNSGRYQQQLEDRLAEWLGVDELAVVSNGADALLAALAAAPTTSGTIAILPSFTFIATLNAVISHGLTPVFCDIDPATFTLCPTALARLLKTTDDVAWVVPVNVFGVPADIPSVMRLAQAAGAQVLYDNCHGFGTELEGRRVLEGPTAQTLSMHATKVLPGIEGGVVLSQDRDLLGRVRQMRNHGIAPNPLQSVPGVNTKLDEVRAAITLTQLDRIDGAITRRRDYGKRLRGFIDRAGLGGFFQLQRIPENVRSNFQNHGVLCPAALEFGRDAIIDALGAHGVGARPYFHPALHRLEGYQGLDVDLPHTETVWSSWICLPLHARMSERDIETMENALIAVADQFGTDYASPAQTEDTRRTLAS